MPKIIKYFLLIILVVIFPFSSKADDSKLSDVDLNRLNYALESIDLIKNDWVDYSKVNPAILLFGEKGNWLFNAIEKPESYNFIEKYKDKPIYFNPKSVSLPSSYLPYSQVKTSIVGMAFFYSENIESTFSFKNQPWFLISKLDDLSNNHPGFDKTTTTEEWLSIFIHEHFHISQFTHPSVANFVSERTKAGIFITQDNLKDYYINNKEYQKYIKDEYDLLSNSLKNNPDQKEAKITLKKWLELYNKRIEKFNPDFSKNNPDRSLYLFDCFWTFVEGIARYIESDYLIEKKYHSSLEIKNDSKFSNFKDTINNGYNGLPEANKRIGSKYFYSIGMHLGFLLDKAEPNWKKELFNTNDWLIGFIKKIQSDKENL